MRDEEAFQEHHIYMSPQGDDNGDGSIACPAATFVRIKALLRALPASGRATVYLRGGLYRIKSELVFGPEDRSNVQFQAYPNETPVISSAIPLTGFEECLVNGVTVWKKQVSFDFESLFDETGRLNTPRLPRSNTYHLSQVDPADSLHPEHSLIPYNTAVYGQLGTCIQPMYHENDVHIRILHLWNDETMRIKRYDHITGRIELSRATSLRAAAGDVYYFENVYEELGKEPGEWYLDRTEKTLYYVPRQNEKIENKCLWAAPIELTLRVDGVDHISFIGITFTHSGSRLQEHVARPQACCDIIPMVLVENARSVHFESCVFRELGGSGLRYGFNCHDCHASGCLFEHIGAVPLASIGWRFDEANAGDGSDEMLPENDPRVSDHLTFTNNLIRYYGEVYYSAVAILLIHTARSDLSHNEIHDGQYSGISVGWFWRHTGVQPTSHVTVAHNHIYRIGKGLLADMGGIYMNGRQPGTVVTGNVVHDVEATSYGGWGIYLDGGSSEMLVENNLAYNCTSCASSSPFDQTFGYGNIIRNNIFAFGYDRIVSNGYKPEYVAFQLENNIIVSQNTPFVYLARPEHVSGISNLFWDYDQGEKAIQEAVEKPEVFQQAVFADPLFYDAASGDFRLHCNSPALQIGFIPFDYNKAGVLSYFPYSDSPDMLATESSTEARA